jgi:RNA-directed DNA polymerase
MTVSSVPERARQGTEAASGKPRPDYWWAEASIWTDRMVATLANGVKGGKWFSLIDKVYRPTTLEAGWRQVAGNQGAAGVDGQSIERFAAGKDAYLRELQQGLEDGSYRPLPVRRVAIPKGDGTSRPLGIPAVKDRIVQAAVRMVMEPIFEVQFREGSYGFRPGRGCKDALRKVDELLGQGLCHVVDADLKSYFDTIPHGRLMERVSGSISDGRVLSLVDLFLKQEIMSEAAQWRPTEGTPQGAVLSPLLANLYLHPLDVLMEQRGYRMVRYADDFVILCASGQEAEEALALVKAWVGENGLTLHPDKTRIGDCRQKGQGFEFLGYRFEAGRRYVRKKSEKRLRDKVRNKTRRHRGESLGRIIEDLNPMLAGWFGYFKHAHRSTFDQVDGFVRRRLRSILRQQEKRPGFGATTQDHRQWSNVFFATHGLFTLKEAWRVSHSRCGNQ